MPQGPYPNHRTPPPHTYQHQSSIPDCDQLAGHCHALTHIMPTLCQSEDSCVYRRGTSVLCGPTEVSPRRTISHAVRATKPKHRMPILDQSANHMSFLDQSGNPSPICQPYANSSPILQSNANPRPFRQRFINPAWQCQSIANSPIQCKSWTNPPPIHRSRTKPTILDQSINQSTTITHSNANREQIRQSITNPSI